MRKPPVNNTPNKGGRPKGSFRTQSRLRKTLQKLNDMEDKALQNIKNNVDGKDVDKEVLASSKWVITTAVALSRAAAQEEQNLFNVKVWQEEKREKEERANGTDNVIRFRTTMVDPDDSDDDEDDE